MFLTGQLWAVSTVSFIINSVSSFYLVGFSVYTPPDENHDFTEFTLHLLLIEVAFIWEIDIKQQNRHGIDMDKVLITKYVCRNVDFYSLW